jgi:AcrR family transcriptional regulator
MFAETKTVLHPIMAKKTNIEADPSTEEKIKEAARRVFTIKGFAATRTRDIADEAGINLALLNYYFRSKEKLFEIIMIEKMQKLFGMIAPTLTDPATTLEEKVSILVDRYIDLLIENPNLPIFVLSEIRNNPERFEGLFQPGRVLNGSSFVLQLHERKPDIHPLHFIFNILGMSLFPFIGKPIFQLAGPVDDEQFTKMMLERKQLIPEWIGLILKG